MGKHRVYGADTKEESVREREHRALARRVAADGIVLLENDGVLPLGPCKIALFGAGARRTVKGGSGSGEVNERYSVNIEEGLQNAGFSIVSSSWLDRYDKTYAEDLDAWRSSVESAIKGYGPIRTMKMFDIIHSMPQPLPKLLPIVEGDISHEADTAIYVISRQAGEGNDRRTEKGEYYLSDAETDNIRFLSAHYRALILVINSGGVVDLSLLDEVKVNALVYVSQAGMEGGNALADVLTGKVCPSGRLTDTWACRYEDYPSAQTYSYLSGDLSRNEYYEGTYVGYRWFEANGIKPRYPFGYGLSYTTFEKTVEAVLVDKTSVTVKVGVKNVGKTYPGRETVTLYLKKPDDGARRLVAFAKTDLLAPGEKNALTLCFDIAKEGSFDAQGTCFILCAGEYGLHLGDETAAVLTLGRTVITEEVEHICTPYPDFRDAEFPTDTGYSDTLMRIALDADAFHTAAHDYSAAFSPDEKIRGMLEGLDEKDLCELVTGGGFSMFGYVSVPGVVGTTSVKLLKKGIPNITLSDGPAGLRLMQAGAVQKSGVVLYPEGLPQDWEWGYLKHLAPLVRTHRGRIVYHYMTAFPCETLQAQTWDIALLREVGAAIGREMRETGVSVWLAPGMNIHRNPLCGRNFEYYAEDPLLTGKMAAALTTGVQSQKGCFVAVKHFCCNNQEDNRDHMSSDISEKALREIYLRPFRIAVEEAAPKTVMSSYNMVNGTYTPNSYDLCTKVLRCEWGFDGVVMSDWNSTDKCSHAKAINAGNDLIMPGNKGVKKALLKALKDKTLDKAALQVSAGRVLELIFSSATTQDYLRENEAGR